MLTREYLESLATDTSFSRGQAYFRSESVGKIAREGDKFTAKVHGTYPYKVQLTLKSRKVSFKCSCPYDFEGICKHEVALDVYGGVENAGDRRYSLGPGRGHVRHKLLGQRVIQAQQLGQKGQLHLGWRVAQGILA
ncbi:MAG: hypothetical protein EOO59_15615, partial [Hymenobacter sp.]